ncbi:hypothetical protein [Streptomyces sp. NBC_00996]|uniref:hypothetical protein n=1 Tax=Streptomyces sp. NBC_00996 TaxID=2903710 RepID=UPI003866E632|nr:hypothetical protein OG390_31775 [Streptomyces sp. NBC_00996]
MMPRKQSTAAQKARQRQAATGEKYTIALRAQTSGLVRHRPFSARGAGWAPIIERAEGQLSEVWADCPRPHWEEKFGDLCWKYVPADAPLDVWRVVRVAVKEASGTCQTCPSPGRKRVVWDWDSNYGWVMPWVKACCDVCYHVPEHLRNDRTYLNLVEQYEEAEREPVPVGCCVAIEEVASVVWDRFDQGGVPALLTKLGELRESMRSRSPHYDVFSGHAVVLAVEEACAPLMHRVWQAGVVSEPVLLAAERRQVLQAIDGMLGALSEMAAEERRG